MSFSGHQSFGAVTPPFASPVATEPVTKVENNFATLPNPPAATSRQPIRYVSPYAGKNVNFFRILKSEWLKLWTLRSTWWVVALTVLLMAGFALMFAAIMRTTLSDPDAFAAMAATGGAESAEAGAALAAQGISAVMIVTLGLQFAQLTVAVLGVMMITNEYGSGMIRATFSAAPRRSLVLLAKLLVLLLTTALMAVIGLALAWLVTYPVIDGVDLINPINFASAVDQRALVGAVLYLLAIAMLSLGIGALLRATAGGIFAVVALLMVLPMIFTIILMASTAEWARTVARYLPTNAGEQIYQVGMLGGMSGGLGNPLAPWPGYFVLLGYAVVAFVAAAIVMRRRDA